MDRALNIDRLTTALGQHPRLPSPAELQQLLADTEISLFTGQAAVVEGLIDTAWYLQGVATTRDDLQLYPFERRRLAHYVSGHIFDLALQATDLGLDERLRYTFATQTISVGTLLPTPPLSLGEHHSQHYRSIGQDQALRPWKRVSFYWR